MFSTFARQNSQIIAAVLISGYTGLNIFFKIFEGKLNKDAYDFKTLNKITLGLSLKEEEEAKKIFYRLESTGGNFELFRSNTMDFMSFGFNQLRQGAQIGLPVSYFAKDLKDLEELSPPGGFRHFLDQPVLTYAQIKEKLGEQKLKEFKESLLLTHDGRLFGLTRALVESDDFLMSLSENLLEMVALMAIYTFTFIRSRSKRLQFAQRKRLYLLMGSLFIFISVFGRLFISRVRENSFDLGACNLGLDCCEGSLDYFDKLLHRNKILREVLPNGHQLFDEQGNFKKSLIKLPFVDYYIYTNYLLQPLTDRREQCKKHLVKMIVNKLKSNEEKQKRDAELKAKENLEATNQTLAQLQLDDEQEDGNKWNFLKIIKKWLDDLKTK